MTCRSVLPILLIALVVLNGCGGQPTPSPSPTSGGPVVRGFVFSWGPHEPKNVLDTVRGTFTKDMVLASPLTVPFQLDHDEVTSVASALAAIDFWSYPSHFVSHGSGRRYEPPAGFENRASLSVITDRGAKTVEWAGGFYADDRRARALRDLEALIKGIIESKPEYKQLPPAEGGYL
jgi:hypothetical protein